VPQASAPVAPPGKYFVQLNVAGQTREEAFEVRKDPRVSASEADLAAQFTLWMQARDKVSESTDAVNRLREVRKQWTSGRGSRGRRTPPSGSRRAWRRSRRA